MTTPTPPPDMTVVPVDVLEHHMSQHRRVEALKNIMADFYRRREAIMRETNINLDDGGAKNRLRRVTLNRISVVLSDDWDG